MELVQPVMDRGAALLPRGLGRIGVDGRHAHAFQQAAVAIELLNIVGQRGVIIGRDEKPIFFRCNDLSSPPSHEANDRYAKTHGFQIDNAKSFI